MQDNAFPPKKISASNFPTEDSKQHHKIITNRFIFERRKHIFYVLSTFMLVKAILIKKGKKYNRKLNRKP